MNTDSMENSYAQDAYEDEMLANALVETDNSNAKNTDIQAIQRELYALQEQIDELRRMSTANKIIAKAQQATIDLLSERLDKVLGAINVQTK